MTDLAANRSGARTAGEIVTRGKKALIISQTLWRVAGACFKTCLLDGGVDRQLSLMDVKTVQPL